MTWAKPDIHYKMTCQKISSSPVASLQNASGSKRKKKIQASSLQNDMHDPILTRLISTKTTTYRGHVASHFVVVIGKGIKKHLLKQCVPNAESGPSLRNGLVYDMSTKSMFSSNACTPLPIRAHLYKMICPRDISTKSILSSIYSNQDFLQNGIPTSDSPMLG